MTPVYQIEEPPAKKSRTTSKKKSALASDAEEDDDIMGESTVPGGDGGFVDRAAVMEQELVLFKEVKFTRAESRSPHDKFNSMMKSKLCDGFPNLTNLARKAFVRPGSNADSEKGFNIPTARSKSCVRLQNWVSFEHFQNDFRPKIIMKMSETDPILKPDTIF